MIIDNIVMRILKIIYFVLLATINLDWTYGIDINDEKILEAKKLATEDLRKKLIDELKLRGFEPLPDSPEDKEQTLTKPSEEAMQDDKLAELVLQVMIELCKKEDCTFNDIQQLMKTKIPGFIASCPKKIDCPKSSQTTRMIDGTCNNIERPLEGSALVGQRRFHYSVYDDFINSPRTMGTYRGHLKSAREISNVLVSHDRTENEDVTTTLTYFGQLFSHDIVATPSVRANGSEILCCSDVLGDLPKHWSCFEIDISKHDTFYKNKRCMEFVRSSATVNADCTFGERTQENQITAFIDGSAFYGSNRKTEKNLRAFDDGLMKMTSEDLMPPSKTRSCDRRRNCPFHGGDERANENPALALQHHIFVREHNRVAKAIKRIKRKWNDEKIYQETKKIIVAIFQAITYKEYVPLVIGKSLTEKFGLDIQDKPNDDVYDPKLHPGIFNEFSTAAFRFGHAMMSSFMMFMDKNSDVDFEPLEDSLFAPWDLYKKDKFRAICKGMTVHTTWERSIHMSPSLAGKMFKQKHEKVGLDLAAFNIQRGRDHGIPPYNQIRDACKLPFFQDFDDLPVSSSIKRKLKKVYDDVEDIDLFVGGLIEPKLSDGIVGETFGCLIAEQLRLLMKSDRFFYTNGQSRRSNPKRAGHEFTKNQIREINKVSLAKIMCENSGMDRVQPRVMESPGSRNKVVDCDDLPEPDISKIVEDLD